MIGFEANTSTFLLPEDVPPSAWTGHVPFAFWITEALAPEVLVELGTHHGTSFLAFCQAVAARRLGTRAFAVDTWQGDEHAGFYGEDVYEQLQGIVGAKYPAFARLMRMRFDDAIAAFEDGSIDLLHIDGLHTYEAVRHDFESWLPKLSRRGVVLFHDIAVRERGFGVWRLWDELAARYPAFGFRHTHGLGVLLVGDQAPEALQALCRLRGSADEAAVERAFEALGQRVVQQARADFFEARFDDAEKFRVHYKAVSERVEAALAETRARLSAVDAAREAGQAEATERLASLEARLRATLVSHQTTQAQLAALRGEQAVLRERALSAEAAQQSLSGTLATRDAEIAAARADLRRRDLLLRDAESRAELRQAQVDRVVASHSWRLTAPLRWVRCCLGAIRRGRKLPAYADMRGAPGGDGVRPRPPAPSAEPVARALPGPTLPAQGVSVVARHYLEEVFASDASRRAPEYLPPSAEPAPRPEALRAKAIAFYLPQFHPFDENEAWWGKGFTEWTNVTKAVPQFLGHHQPQLPADLGFYDLRVPDVLKRQVEMARQYGLHGFAFHYYWFAGKRLMDKPLDLYLAQDDIDFPFCLCWANENWTRRWDGHDSEILISQVHGPENDLAFIRDLEPYLRDRRYLRVDGKPLLIVYRPSILPDPAATLRRWREHCREVGIGELFIAMVQFDTEDPREHGFDAAMEFPPHKLAKDCDAINRALDIVNPDYQGHVVHYQSIVDSAKAWPDKGFPLIRTVFPGWDNEARRPGKGYTFAYATPDRYQDWLAFAVEYAERHPVAGERIVMVNAWNEWAEGAKLEPDRRFGHAFLQATRDALEAPRDPRRVLVLSHDAHPHGGQYLALNLARELRDVGVPVSVGLLGPGRLADDFRRLCPVHEAFDDAGVAALVQRCREDGTRLVIANTAVSGRVAPAFRSAGIEVLSLVHELPGVIREYGLEAAVRDLVRDSRQVVVACDAVARGLASFADAAALDDKLVVRPQGLFTRSRYRGQRDAGPARAALRERLGLPPQAKIVLAVGYADPRKGVDLLAEAAVRLADVPDLHFVWVGHRDASVQDAVDRALREGGMAGRFHFVGLDFDTDDYYAGADVYALASREDPFPSVVLESLSVGTPVVAFAGTGGGADLVASQGGVVVSPLTAAAYADALRGLLADDGQRRALGEAGRDLIDARFSFRRYALDLLALGGIDVPKVSVVVPNYNYARYLEGRLRSITHQTLPVYEIIVLDDASTDGSLDLLQSLRAQLSPEPRVVVNARNSGSVFRQWLRGLELATGDYVWIAEADDLAHPGLLEAVVGAMARDPSIVMGYCQSEQMDPDGQTLAPDYLDYTRDVSPDRWHRPYVADGQDEAACLGVKNVVPNASAVVFRREPLLQVLREGIDEIAGYSIAGDWVVYLRLLTRGRVCFEPSPLNRHRRHAGSVTLGSALARHYDEVARAQAEAQRLFPVDDAVRAAAGAYLRSLRVQFGLDDVAREAG
ncbi:MAG TPA: glycoside hydrolase family 99-like domain-containing protein [Arenimonas sp.]|uniref:glycoside hydrolase family 99-like domain-containing protein n=1 Tax=Arenimonas sp. TaxID=1872635 RepID=UPI002D803B14|nr:glycoside hydrolase family 99-like domain-containing protein [Arenimonas sp.]HEU0151717.1 glycoside hydrolase family 99-like domain-containing protein [Arenimonas sp.]